MTDVSYVYALIRSNDGELPPLPVGVEDRPVRVVEAGRVSALVSSVDGRAFSSTGLEQRLGDLQWVERTARAHDSVVNAAAMSTTTLPLRLGTTCADDDAVVALFVDLEQAALRTFSRLDGRQEWGLRILARPAGERPVADPGESGTTFLTRRRAELQQQAGSAAADRQDADDVFAALAGIAHDARRHATRTSAGFPSGSRPTILNAAFLVDDAAEAQFLAAVRQIQERLGDERLVLTGPWAAYSFAELDRT